MENEFDHVVNSFLRVYASFNPIEANEFGWREFAGILPDPSEEKIDAYRLMLSNTRDRVQSINVETLDNDQHLDLLILQNKIDAELFNLDELNIYQRNPITYTSPALIFDYILKNYAPISQRIEELMTHLQALPKFYATAVKNLDRNLPIELVDMAHAMLTGSISFIDNIEEEIRTLYPEISLDKAILDRLDNAKRLGISGIRFLIRFLEDTRPNCSASFRLGDKLYSKMLNTHERVDISIEDILKAGWKNLEENMKEMKEAALQIDPEKSVNEIMMDIRNDHPTSDSLLQTASDILENIRQFLIDSDFVSVPSEVRINVIHTPKPLREWAFAACDTPGALEREATDSYYYITPPDEAWTPKEQNEWLGTFNYPGMIDISVHEVWPGHYLHHLHNQRSKSIMSKLFGAYHFWEGYALHVEEAMWQAGFQKNDNRYRMAQLTETLLRNVRLIVSIRLHTDETFTVDDGTDLFMKYAFLGRKPAEAESKRGTYDPGYLNYCLGKLLIEKLQQDYKEELAGEGKEYTNKTFYDTLLSYGAPPVPILRKFMLDQPEKEML
jgi:uncharacterized protein (DUF885 family)